MLPVKGATSNSPINWNPPYCSFSPTTTIHCPSATLWPDLASQVIWLLLRTIKLLTSPSRWPSVAVPAVTQCANQLALASHYFIKATEELGRGRIRQQCHVNKEHWLLGLEIRIDAWVSLVSMLSLYNKTWHGTEMGWCHTAAFNSTTTRGHVPPEPGTA